MSAADPDRTDPVMSDRAYSGRRGPAYRLLTAAGLSAFSLLLTIAARDLLTGSVFLLFFPSVIATAWLAGFWPALLVVAVAVCAADVLFLEPLGTLSLPGPLEVAWLGLYASVAALVARMTSMLAEARRESDRLLAELRRAHGAVQESERRFRAMADHAPVLIWSAGRNGLCRYFNAPWLAFTGRTLEQELGDGWAASVHPDDLDGCIGTYRNAFARRDPFRREYRLRRNDGDYRHVLDCGVPRFGPDGEFAGYIGSCVDVHDHVEAQRQLQENAAQLEELTVEQEQMMEELQMRSAEAEAVREQAQHANAAKSRFLAVMSHELRTPLNAILGYADLLAGGIGGEVNETQMRHVGRIRDSVVHLRDLIDQILSLSRIEAGREEVRAEPVDVCLLVRKTVDMVTPQAQKRGLELDVLVPLDPLHIETDARKLRQIVLNLLANAVKFTECGGVRVELEHRNGTIDITVRDTGVGIAEEDLGRIFEPFTQVDESTTRRAAGTGLGLAVSLQLAELMQGSLTASSTPGSGSAFRLSIPFRRALVAEGDGISPTTVST